MKNVIEDFSIEIDKTPKLEFRSLLIDKRDDGDPALKGTIRCTQCNIVYECPVLIWFMYITLYPPPGLEAAPMVKKVICTKCALYLMERYSEKHMHFYKERTK